MTLFDRPLRWRKLGRLLTPRVDLAWNQTHMMLPSPLPLGGSRVRVYYGGRDHLNRSRIGFAEIDLANPGAPARTHPDPVLDLGELGTFDDNGVVPSCLLRDGDRLLLFYVGWNPRGTVRFALFPGLAESEDGGLTFRRLSRAPLFERTDREPFLNTAPMVVDDGGTWRTYYVSGEGWITPDRPRYNIKYAEARRGEDGRRMWRREARTCIDFGYPGEHSLARPCVVRDGDRWRMWFSYKGADYDLKHNYRIGYAESEDGLAWVRRDDLAGIDVSPSGWDSEMVAYAYVIMLGGLHWMFYNGNGYGEAGIGLAVAE